MPEKFNSLFYKDNETLFYIRMKKKFVTFPRFECMNVTIFFRLSL